MKRCIETHTVAAFGEVPAGSLWADDSPYIEDESLFVDADYRPAKSAKNAKGATEEVEETP
jgi:hypothetical protein